MSAVNYNPLNFASVTPTYLAMKTLILLKDIYQEAFVNLGHFITRNFFKVFTWFSFIMFVIVLYAFIFRIATGFAFD